MVNKLFSLFRKKPLPRVEFRPSGRLADLVYVTEDAEAKMTAEMSGSSEYDILAHAESLQTWSNGKQISEDEKLLILRALKSWEKNSTITVQW